MFYQNAKSIGSNELIKLQLQLLLGKGMLHYYIDMTDLPSPGKFSKNVVSHENKIDYNQPLFAYFSRILIRNIYVIIIK